MLHADDTAGWLEMESKALFGLVGLKRRYYFVCDADKQLLRWELEGGAAAGMLQLKGGQCAANMLSTSPGAFVIRAESQVLCLVAASAGERDQWLQALRF